MASTPLESTTIRDPLVGAKLGDYQVIGPIGEGGMGVVYEGLHTVINKRVAIKVIKSEFAGDQVLVRRVVTEAQAVNAVRHRGIVDIHAHGVTPDGRPYLVMELLQGETVHDLLAREGLLARDLALQLVFEATGPLFAAHKAGIVHRDLKPSNLFLCEDDDGERFMKLLDFGLAKRSAPGVTSSTMTSASLIVGTPDYMAPEQARAQPTDARTDIYALGVMAFELLAGKLPYSAPSSVDLVMKHLTAPIPRLVDLDPTFAPELSQLVEQMMAKDAADRPQTLEPVRALLKQLLGRGVGGDLVPRPSPVRHSRVTPAFLEATAVRPSGQRAKAPTPAPEPPTADEPVPPSVDAPLPRLEQTVVGVEPLPVDELATADTRASLEQVPTTAELKTDPMRPAPEVKRVASVQTVRDGSPAVDARPPVSKLPLLVGAGLLLSIAVGLAVILGGKETSQRSTGGGVTVVTPNPVDDPHVTTKAPPVVAPLALVVLDAGDDSALEIESSDPAEPAQSNDAGTSPAHDPKVRADRTTPKPSPKRAPTRDELLARISKLRPAAAGNASLGRFLDKYQEDAQAARTADDALAVSAKLDLFQKQLKAK